MRVNPTPKWTVCVSHWSSTDNRDCLKAELAQKTKEIQDNLDLEIGRVVARIEQLEAKMD